MNQKINYIISYGEEISGTILFYISIFTAVLSLLFVLLIILFLKNSRMRERYKEKMITLSTIYNSLPDLVFCKNLERVYINCNESFEKFTGMSESELIGKSTSEVLSDSESIALELDEEKVFSEQRTQTTVKWMTNAAGSKILIEFVQTPLVQDGKVIGLLGIGRDITVYKKAEEEALETSRAKSSFLAKMSHEIRTPMNAITGMAELALRECELDAALEHIFTIKQAGANLLAIINDILDFSKIETGKLEIMEEEYSAAALISDLIGVVRMKFIDSPLRFAVNIDSSIPKFLIGDETRVRQIIINILNNAVKYTERGYVSFKVSAEKISENTDTNYKKGTVNLIIEIADTGKGIKEEDIGKLFDDFVQVDAEINKGIEGTGLGLAITHGLVKAMNGTICVDSEYGKGSIFTVTLPQKFSSAEKLAQIENSDEKSVIVYERREIYAKSIGETMSNLGVDCTLVSSDTELYKKMSCTIYNFIFISFTLYEKNKETIMKYGQGVKIVVLADFGELIPDKSLSILAMPFHTVPISNILNGVTKSFTYRDNGETVAKFTAPDARVLIVDDVSTNLRVADGLLSPYKMRIDLCRSGEKAIEMIKASAHSEYSEHSEHSEHLDSEAYDLIFMDHRMPVMDGEETTLRIRALEGEYYQKLPIIALTANAVSEIMERLLLNGFDDFLSKPIDTVKMNSILEKWIPKEKQKKMTYRNIKNTKNTNNINIDSSVKADDEQDKTKIEIKGIDADKGIEMAGGTLDNYLQILAVFCKDVSDCLKEIKACMAEGNMTDYIIYVHAIKSASASIGADEISAAAKSLENAGNTGDLAYIGANNDRFISDLETLLDDINNTITLNKYAEITDLLE